MVKKLLVACALSLTLAVGVVVAVPAYAGTLQLHTVHSFVETLIARGIIPESVANKAREFVSMISHADQAQTAAPAAQMPYVQNPEPGMNKENVSIKVSQLIEHADRTYNKFEDVSGLLLLVTNTSDASVMLEAKRHCQVVYRIYDAHDTLVYDSSTSDVCQGKEHVQYQLPAGKTRMFEITHAEKAHHLDPGTYRFELVYPGYGTGDLQVTIR